MGATMNGSSTDFVVSSNGYTSPLPDGSNGPNHLRNGTQYSGGLGGKGFDDRVSRARIMEGNWNQGPRTVYENNYGQKVDPWTGRTVADDHKNAHFYHNSSR